jgi:hypothetical protein
MYAGPRDVAAILGMSFAPFTAPTPPNRRARLKVPTSEHPAYAREVFSLAGARVTLDTFRGWQCTCAAGRLEVPCAHIEQAQVLRHRRGARRTEDTIELELTAEQLRALSDVLPEPAEELAPATNVVKARAKRRSYRWDWATFVAALAISGASSGVTYLAVKQGAPTTAPAQPMPALRIVLQPQLEAQPEPAVTFVNPFDKTETFEFPSGTSASSAREAVAELLLKRAQERLGKPAAPGNSARVSAETPARPRARES